jgi:Protein of unknown function (DUF3047)
MPGGGAEAAACVLAVLLSTAASAPASAQAVPLLPPPIEVDGLAPGWKVVGLPKQTPPQTRYLAVHQDGRNALRLEADHSYANLVYEWPAAIAAPRWIAWSWRVDEMPASIALARKEGDDTPARVCLGLALPLERLPFFERQKLRMARSLSGQELPAATLCWAWGAAEAAGSVVVNPYSARLRTVVLRGRADALGRWHDERRDVFADFRLAFGDEWDGALPPPAIAALVAADADNTGGRSRAFVTGLRIEPGVATRTPP